MSAELRQPGTLVLVVGSSGVGKDTVIRGARSALAADTKFVFPSRYITRPIDPSEDHVPLTQAQFADLLARGLFTFQWSAHGLNYGVPGSIDDDLAAERIVVCNVSRSVVQPVSDRYQKTTVVEVRAPLPLRAARLAARNRESAADVAARLSRDVKTTMDADFVVENKGMPTDAIRDFVQMLQAIAHERTAW